MGHCSLSLFSLVMLTTTQQCKQGVAHKLRNNHGNFNVLFCFDFLSR